MILIALAECVSAQSVAGRAEVVDGDTLRIAGETVRLHAMDAPESRQLCRGSQGDTWACGQEATRALAALVARDAVRCDGVQRDRYGRLVARCRVGGVDLASELVRSGAAFASARYGRAYVADEARARAAGKGLWRGGADRAGIVVHAGRAATGACAIKGNISASGQIYHVPGQRHYDATRISQARGERWFCSERAARAAGWRAALR